MIGQGCQNRYCIVSSGFRYWAQDTFLYPFDIFEGGFKRGAAFIGQEKGVCPLIFRRTALGYHAPVDHPFQDFRKGAAVDPACFDQGCLAHAGILEDVDQHGKLPWIGTIRTHFLCKKIYGALLTQPDQMSDHPALFECLHLFCKFICQTASRIIDCVERRFYGTHYNLYTE